MPREKLTILADYLRGKFNAHPELIVAEDARLENGGFILRYLFELEDATRVVVASVSVPAQDPTFPSLATRWYLASRFEREIHDLFGLVPTGHPDLRRLPLHQFWPDDYHPLLKDATLRQDFSDDGEPYPFRRVEGEGVYEIAVGPVHAGIIEPGHFRFSVDGETIINLESRMYFVHKGIEKLFESATLDQGVKLAERISGDSSVAHALSFCQAVEAFAGVTIPSRAAYLRVVLLELERLYNHIADVGAICTDTGFALANAHALRLREDLLRLNARLAGHRLLRGTLVPGGVARDFGAEQIVEARDSVARISADFNHIVEIATSNGLVLDVYTAPADWINRQRVKCKWSAFRRGPAALTKMLAVIIPSPAMRSYRHGWSCTPKGCVGAVDGARGRSARGGAFDWVCARENGISLENPST